MARYMRAGISKFYFVTTIAAFPAITHTEAAAGTDISPQVMTINGFEFANQPIKTPDFGTTFETEIPGKDQVSSSDIEFYQVKGTDSIRTALAKGTAGYILAFYDGLAGGSPAASDKCDAFPVIVASNSKVYKADNSAASYKVTFSITTAPALDVSLS